MEKDRRRRYEMVMLKGVRPSVALGRDTTMLREILDKTAERVGQDLQDQPEVEAETLFREARCRTWISIRCSPWPCFGRRKKVAAAYCIMPPTGQVGGNGSINRWAAANIKRI